MVAVVGAVVVTKMAQCPHVALFLNQVDVQIQIANFSTPQDTCLVVDPPKDFSNSLRDSFLTSNRHHSNNSSNLSNSSKTQVISSNINRKANKPVNLGRDAEIDRVANAHVIMATTLSKVAVTQVIAPMVIVSSLAVVNQDKITKSWLELISSHVHFLGKAIVSKLIA